MLAEQVGDDAAPGAHRVFGVGEENGKSLFLAANVALVRFGSNPLRAAASLMMPEKSW